MKKIISALDYKATWSGLLRIIGWMVLFLFLASVIIPRPPIDVPLQNQLEGTRVIPMNMEISDPRWVRNDIDAFPKTGYKNIAWIAESSVVYTETEKQGDRVLRKTKYLPDKVNRLLEEKHNVKANAFLYLLKAGRVLDTYTMVQDALARKPDAMVVVLNPCWIYNNKAVFNKISVFNRGAGVWWNDRDWIWQFSLVSPRSHLWNFIGQHIPIVASSHDYNIMIDEKAEAMLGLQRLKANSAIIAQDAADNNLRFNQSLMFWVLYRIYGGKTDDLYPHGNLNVPVMQSLAVGFSDTSPNAFSSVIVQKLMEIIKNSGTPTLIYLAPVSPKMRRSELASKGYEIILKSLLNIKQEYESKNTGILIRFPKSVLDSIEFFDFVHLNNEGIMSDVLSEELLNITRWQ